MNRSRKASWVAALLVAVGMGLAFAAVQSSTARAQLRDPPLGWDMWDPGWMRRDSGDPQRADQSLRWRMTRHEAFVENGVQGACPGARESHGQNA